MQQKALSLMQFQKKFGTEKACQKHLFRLRWPEGFRCPHCQHDKAYFQRTRNLYHCKACGYQASLTAGTVFHKTRTPLHKWFWMIWLMGRQKSGISMLSLQRMLEITTYKTVWTMGHHHLGLAGGAPATFAGFRSIEVGVIHLDQTGQFVVGVPFSHGLANLVAHGPHGFIGFNFQHSLQGQHGNAAFLAPHQPDHPEPFVQRGSGLVKHDARGQRDLIAAGPAMI